MNFNSLLKTILVSFRSNPFVIVRISHGEEKTDVFFNNCSCALAFVHLVSRGFKEPRAKHRYFIG